MLVLRKLKNIFGEKKVIVVSSSGISTVRIGNFTRFIGLLLCCWVVFTSAFFFVNTKIQRVKNAKIEELRAVNLDLNNSITNLNYVVGDIKEYLSTLNYYDRFSSINVKKLSDLGSITESSTLISSNEYRAILPVLDSIERDMIGVEVLVNARIDGINSLLKETALDEEAKNIYKASYRGVAVENNKDLVLGSSTLVNKKGLLNLKESMRYLDFLESFLSSIPISKPMDNYYLTSRYGTRIDPFTKQAKFHRGIDMVGPTGSFVVAPAGGIVRMVGERGGFGNSIDIDHGNNIMTVYAHLAKSLVRVGDTVKKGDKIGIQGSSGRSTGQHLHWEVSVNRNSVDPAKFLKISEKIY
ncbi:MAG: M23 family metallopeptidase [Rickettsiales bacterium]|nr:M23 family metallopeptidase [Rickettsiales bacterium]